MNQYELETFEMTIEMFDHNDVFTNELIGSYSIGLSTLYNFMDHEIYRNWIGLFHKDNVNKICAYVQISAFIIGPGDGPPRHSADEALDDELPIDSDDDEEEIARKIASIKKSQGCLPVEVPNKIVKSF